MDKAKWIAFGMGVLGTALGVAIGLSAYHGVLKHFVDSKVHVKKDETGKPVKPASEPAAVGSPEKV